MRSLQSDSFVLQGLNQFPWDEEGALLLHFLLLKELFIILALRHDVWAMTGGGIQDQLINNLTQGNSSRTACMYS